MIRLYYLLFGAVALVGHSKTGQAQSTNTIIGYQSGLNNTAEANTFLGYQAGLRNSSGIGNVFIGSQAGYNNMTGTGNLFLGQQAGVNSLGSYNLFMGNASGSATTSGLGNTAIGDGSLLRNATGIHNTAIGRYAGVDSQSDENTFIGFAANVTSSTPNLTNATAIGARALVSQSNSIVLGANANVGIGTSSPQNRLEITYGTAGYSGLRFTNLTSNSPLYGPSTNQFLTVNANGDVVLAAIGGSKGFRAAATPDSLATWANEGDNLRNANRGGVVIGQNVTRTPAGYKLFVEQGILTERVKVAVKNSSEWSDYVFSSSYHLKPIKDVEAYINVNKRLPDIPSAKEMVAQGNDLHRTDARLLAKIEELTLYVIQQNKRIALVERQNQQLTRKIKSLTQGQ